MIGDYVLHYPITDFAVSLLVVAAGLDVARLLLHRTQWSLAVDVLLVLGLAGALASVATGLWLTSVQLHVHDDELTLHHYFAYGAFGAAGTAALARLFVARARGLAIVKTVALVVSAVLVSGAGFFGGMMAHPSGNGDHADGDAAMPGSHAHTHEH